MKLFFKSIAVITLLSFMGCNEPKKVEVEETEEVSIDLKTEKEAVIAVMKKYKDAIQALTTEGTVELFTKEATVFESGGSEGTYETYVSHHLGPELDYFNSFIFSDYKIDVSIDFPFAFTTESYIYTIDVKVEEGEEPYIIEKKGVATSTLKKSEGTWKIIRTHSSSRGLHSGH